MNTILKKIESQNEIDSKDILTNQEEINSKIDQIFNHDPTPNSHFKSLKSMKSFNTPKTFNQSIINTTTTKKSNDEDFNKIVKEITTK